MRGAVQPAGVGVRARSTEGGVRWGHPLTFADESVIRSVESKEALVTRTPKRHPHTKAFMALVCIGAAAADGVVMS